MTELRARPSRRLIVLGSTGSIGVNALEVVDHLHAQGLAELDVVGLAAGANTALLARQAARFGVEHVAVADGGRTSPLDGIDHVYTGSGAAQELVEAIAREGDLLLGAMVGSAGVPATLTAIDRGCDIALANKETLVAAGELVLPRATRKGVHLLPVDSEHSAIAQCLRSGRTVDEVRRLVLTASGGPFRTWEKQRLFSATPEQALRHPTWNMGRKVTIDSASMMNKALEVIEAHWLFDMPASKIEVIVHPQSLVHGFVEFEDGSVAAQLSPPDMRMPIQYALTWPQRLEGCARSMDWTDLRRMEFEPVDDERFPAVRLAYDVIGRGGTAGAVLNAANEAAVTAFLDHRIPFGLIPRLAREALEAIPVRPVERLEDVLEADRLARAFVADHSALAAGSAAASSARR
ncbi:MAG: 1-deoxy-D-xylulose-5-phosphate reductoisomerase [Planctomycetota bacterium]|nr:1-deoxy-D-xylulose-5-phosphate reductoisomerase [Planctomycetota bacterium]